LSAEVVSIHRRGVFTYEEARGLIPVVVRLSRHYNLLLDDLIARLEKTPPTLPNAIADLETRINNVIHQWNAKIVKLGGKPRGLWIVDFDHGAGYYCWKHPETDLLYAHGYNQEPRDRRPLHVD
jgi:hypothetical protein